MTATGMRLQGGLGVDHALPWANRSPVLWPQWYEAAGWSSRTEIVRNGRAAIPAWVVRPGEHHFHDPFALIMGSPGGWPDHTPMVQAAHRGALVTISPYGYRGGAWHDAATSDEDLLGLGRRLIERARALDVSVVLSHYLYAEDDAAWIAALSSCGGQPVVLGADAVIDVTWADLDAYYRWLGSGRRAQRSEGRRLDAPEVVWRRHEVAGPPAEGGRMIRLLTDSAARFDADDPPPERLFKALVEGVTIPRALLSVGDIGAETRSVLAVLRNGRTLHAKAFGTSVPRADYFPLVYPGLIRYGIEHGVRRIEYGGGSHQAKLLRGARLRFGYGVLVVVDEKARPIMRLARSAGERNDARFRAMARRFQHPSHTIERRIIPPKPERS